MKMIKSTISKHITDLAVKFAETAIVKRFKAKNTNTYLFITKRLSINKFSGLPLTILCIALISNLFLLFDFTEETINSKEFIAIDNFIAKLFFIIRIESLARGFYFISKLCNISVVSSIGALLITYVLITKKLHFLIGILTSLLGSGLSIFLGKNIFEVDRPHQYAYYQENYFSFPSGHSTVAVSFYGLLLYFLIRNSPTFKIQGLLISIAFIFWIFIGISRLYLCVHYFSDVIAGYILGFFWLLLSISIVEWKNHTLHRAN